MLGKLQPTNEKSEKRRFLTAWRKGEVYNPVFQYADPDYCEQLISAFDTVFYSEEYAGLAERILLEILQEYGSAEGYKAAVWGRQIAPDEAMNRAVAYTRQHNIRAQVFFGTSLVTTMGSKGLSLVSAPGYYRDVRLDSLLDHELSVHFLRSKNNRLLDDDMKARIRRSRLQHVEERLSARHSIPVPPDIVKILTKQMITVDEEGLACVVTNMSYTQNQKFFQPALSNYMVHMARRTSFHACFQHLSQRRLCVDDEDCWIQVLRVKRGLCDTSRGGGLCKDLLNFVGAMKILSNIERMNIRVFYSAKLRCEEYFAMEEELLEHYRRNGGEPGSRGRVIQLPHFLATQAAVAEFMGAVRVMQRANYIVTRSTA
jgi:hypothetical protein